MTGTIRRNIIIVGLFAAAMFLASMVTGTGPHFSATWYHTHQPSMVTATHLYGAQPATWYHT